MIISEKEKSARGPTTKSPSPSPSSSSSAPDTAFATHAGQALGQLASTVRPTWPRVVAASSSSSPADATGHAMALGAATVHRPR
jgi:hypothetical protein